MILVALVIGIVLVVAAIRNSYTALFSAIGTDAPGFTVWAAAVIFVGALGFVPAFKTPSRALLALILIVIVINNYQAVFSGLAAAAKPGAGATGATGGQSNGATAGQSPSATGAASSVMSQLSNYANTINSFASMAADPVNALTSATGG
jgi:hypothetical protein